MNKKESMTIEDFAKYADRVKRITEYKNNVNNELTQNESQAKPIDVEQIEMWQDIQESLNVGSLGVYEKRKLSNLIAMQIERLKGNL